MGQTGRTRTVGRGRVPTGDSVSVDRKENAVSGARLLLLKCTAAFKRQHPIPHRFKRAAGAFLGQS